MDVGTLLPHVGGWLVVCDAGAYCHAMSSNYNLKKIRPEYPVDGDNLTCIRRVETLDDYLRVFNV